MDRETEDAIAEAAASWDTRLRAAHCTAQDRAAFASWLDADPAHRQTFQRLQAMFSVLRGEMSRPELRSLRDGAVAAASRRKQRRNWAIAAGFAGAALMAALWMNTPRFGGLGRGFVSGFASDSGETYVTGIGQRTNVTLPDGSTLELNARTKVHVEFDDKRRLLTLLDGQALFRVARNPRRPFVVRARDREIVALGTTFDVRLERTSLRVTLLEGKVSVSHGHDDGAGNPLSAAKPLKAVVLTPGEQLVVTGAVSVTSRTQPSEALRDIDVAKVTGWREGRVFIEDLSLGDAVAEMNKHSAVQVIVTDPALERLRVNGMFRAGEQRAFAAALETYFRIEAEPRGESEIVLVPRRPSP